MKLFIPLIILGTTLFADIPVIPFKEVSQESLNQVTEGQSQVFFFDQGDTFPLGLQLDGDTLSLESKPVNGKILVKRPFFMKMGGEDFSFSLDNETWLPFEKFFTGQIRFAIGVSDEAENPYSNLRLHLDIR